MHYHERMKLLCMLLLLAGLVAPADQSELVAEFRRYYAKAKTPRERWEAVQVLKDIDSLEAAQALSVAFEDEDFAVRRAAIDVVASFRREDSAQWLADEILLSRKQAKKTRLRAGAAEALGGMGQAFAYIPLSALLEDKDPELRMAAIAALGRLKEPRACRDLSLMAASEDGSVALAALDALVSIGSGPGAQDAVLAAMQHADWRVRARAIAAVYDLRLKAGIRPLIERLAVEPGRLAGDAYQMLKSITLRDFGDTAAEWQKWWDRSESSWELPDFEKVAAAREAERKSGTRYTTGKKEFLGVATRSENILFVIDVSGSMEVPFADTERLKSSGRQYSSFQRLQIVKEELLQTIAELPESTGFNIIAFASDVKVWKKEPVRANVLNKSAASDWVSRLKPLGGQSAGFKAQAGLSREAANEGQTNTHLALMTALGEPPESKGGQGFVTAAPKNPLDTIFFLTDGEPTVGKSVDMREIRGEVRRVNGFRGVQIHVIYVGEFGGDDMEKLAHENGGVFVSIGG
jgi:hypothetical protein